MAVNQNFIDNLKLSLARELKLVTEKYVNKGNIGINIIGGDKDVNRLYILSYILDRYNINSDYHTDSYIQKIASEFKILCQNKVKKKI